MTQEEIINSNNETYKQGDRIYFDNGSVSGYGTVCGQSSNPVVLLGATYIIEPDVTFDKNVYDFTHFAMQQLYMKKI